MTSFFTNKEGFGDFEELMKRLFELQRAVQSGALKGEWDVQQIDHPEIKGYIIQGRIQSDQPIPFNPSEPLNPWKRRPMPQRPFRNPSVLDETREPLTDIFQDDKTVNIYLELPGVNKEDIQLNVTKGNVEVKTKDFYKTIDIPENIDLTKASSKYNNGVLIITIPKKKSSTNDKHTITIQ
jgi:HSP20 family molecular chaperone IbpA